MKCLSLASGLTLAFCVFFAPSASDASSLGLVCRAHRSGDDYTFTAHYPPEAPGPGEPDQRLPMSGMEIRQSGRFVWGLRADGSETDLVDSVTYGKVPPDYSQYVPTGGLPGPLRIGEIYEMTCGVGTGAFLVTPDGVENLARGDPRARVGACTCRTEDSPLAAFKDAAAVFVGRVEHDEAADIGAESYRRVTFAVSRRVKGVADDFVIVLDGPRGGDKDCVFWFEAGGSYLVYARRMAHLNHLVTDRCTRTRQYDASGEREAQDLLR